MDLLGFYGFTGHNLSIHRCAKYVNAEAKTSDKVQIKNVHILIPNLVSGSQMYLSHLVGGILIFAHSSSLFRLILKAGNVLSSLVAWNGIINCRSSKIVKIFQAIVSGMLSVSLAGFRAVKSCHSQYCGSSRCFQIQSAALANSWE